VLLYDRSCYLVKTMTAPVVEERIDGRRVRGDRSRRAILEAAASLASVEGLEGLTLGRLAEHLGISKSGVYAHFGSKEELQLATIRAAVDMYGRDVMGKAMTAPLGIPRILAFADTFLAYIQHGPFPGGCFFIASFLDPATLRPPVKEALARAQRELLDFMTENARVAQAAGDLPADTDAGELAFEIDAVLVGADVNYRLFDDPVRLERAADALRRRLGVTPRWSG
jgi:AcrR family transcriptional regulator